MINTIAPESIRQYDRIPDRGEMSKKIESADIFHNKNLLQLTYYNGEGHYEDSLLFNPKKINQIEKKYLKAFVRVH